MHNELPNSEFIRIMSTINYISDVVSHSVGVPVTCSLEGGEGGNLHIKLIAYTGEEIKKSCSSLKYGMLVSESELKLSKDNICARVINTALEEFKHAHFQMMKRKGSTSGQTE